MAVCEPTYDIKNKGKTFREKWDEGYPIFEKLFNLKSTELKETLKDIIPEKYHDILTESGHVRKEIYNDMPTTITINNYDWLSISPYGIQYNPEHGTPTMLIEFNNHFKL